PAARAAAATSAPAPAVEASVAVNPAPRPGPVKTTFTSAFAYGLSHPNLDPAGANDFTCRPSPAHPRPVVLLHGTYANRFNSFASMAPTLAAQGYCVFALDYGRGYLPGLYGMQAIRSSARELAGFVDRVLAATGAPQVDLVGYSQGGLVARAYLKFSGGQNPADPAHGKVASLIGLSADNHGTTLLSLTRIVDFFRTRPLVRLLMGNSAVDQIADSPFLGELNRPAETLPGVQYTMVATTTDEISRPANRAWLTAAPGTAVTNVLLQDGCPTDHSDHFNITYSPRAQWIVLHTLDPTYPAPEPCKALGPLR
ncbi:MAG: alpha/beta fold hydrolase, partial [Patulibacter sp.]|nr:alpha/beta fold hydrolase [Patulibacter sp.]